MGDSSDSLSTDSPSDEAASDPSDHEEPAPTAKAAAGPKPRLKLKRPEVKEEQEPKERPAPEFQLSIESLQGRWRHSVAALGMLCVQGSKVTFSDGSSYELKEISPGRIDMGGWQTIALKSSPEVIVWMLGGDPATTCNWLLEEDADQENALEGLDSRNIIQGKRRRAKVDYAALEKEIDTEEKRREDVCSDSSGSERGRGRQRNNISVQMSSKEWRDQHVKESRKAADLFRRWMLSTNERHEELLRQKGRLKTRLPVVLIGPGRRMLEQELSPYGVKLRFHTQETLALVDLECLRRFQERHAAEWASEHRAQAPAPAAAAAVEEPPQASPKKRRLRRVVASDEEEAEAKVETAEVAEVHEEEVRPGPMELIQQVKKCLEASPAPDEVSKLLASLESQKVDSKLLVTTKIGVTVNGLRKSYAKHPEIVCLASSLVARWKDIWTKR